MTNQLCVFSLILSLSASAVAQTPQIKEKAPSIKEAKEKDSKDKETNTDLPLSFRAWKEQQLLDAQNAVLRAQSNLRQSDSDSRSKAEKEVRRANDQVDVVKELSVDEYLAIYLVKFQDKPELVLQMIEKLPKEEAKEILTGTFRKAFQQNNAKQKTPALMIGRNSP